MKMTVEELKQQIEKWDLLITPYVIFCNSVNESMIKEITQDAAKIITCEIINPDVIYLVDRTKLLGVDGKPIF